MNCDHAFELMTDSALDDSAALHEHLDQCPRCRQMYETLSPALGLFHQVDDSPSPTFDEGSVTSVEIAERVAVRLSAPPSANGSSTPRLHVMVASLAMGVIGFVSAWGLASMMTTPASSSEARASECAWMNHAAARSTNQSSDAVVLSCVACHLSSPAE